jgi:hypothetical protein
MIVMAGRVPAMHVFLLECSKDVDARHKAGHDEFRYEALFPGSVPIILHNTVSITSSAPPPIEVSRLSR